MTGLETAGAVASIATAVATTVTLAVLIWYTIETHRLRKESQRQNEIALLPLVVVEEPYEEHPDAFGIRNIGRGPAFQVFPSLRTAFDKHPKDCLGSGIAVTLQIASMLGPGEEGVVKPVISSESDPFSTTLSGMGALVELVLTNKITETFAIEIYYEALYGKAYLTKFVATYVGGQRQFALFYESTMETDKRVGGGVGTP